MSSSTTYTGPCTYAGPVATSASGVAGGGDGEGVGGVVVYADDVVSLGAGGALGDSDVSVNSPDAHPATITSAAMATHAGVFTPPHRGRPFIHHR